MSRFNTTIAPSKTENLAGGEAYVQSPKFALVSHLLTSFVQDQFYRTAEKGIEDLRTLINAIPDKTFVAKAAIYARTKFGMRSVSHVVAGEIAASVKGEKWTKGFFEKIVFRPDDMTEILAYYRTLGKKDIPHALRKGFATKLTSLKEYQVAKYRGEGKDFSLVDVVNLVHPTPTPALTKLVKGTLKNTETWEAKLTEAGKQSEDADEKVALKHEAWGEMLKSGNLGYMALLKNLRNIMQTGDKELVALACGQLVDEKAIRKSLVFPFRFLTAAEEIGSQKDNREVMIALTKAMDISLGNVPKLPGKTLVAVDVSGSMQGKPEKIAKLFAAALFKSNDCDVIRFDTSVEYVTLNPLDSMATIANGIKFRGGGTDFNLIFQAARQKYDRVVILSDMQAWVGYYTPKAAFAAYRAKFNADPTVFCFDLAGNGSLQFPESRIYQLAGFSDKVFDVMKLLEQDREALISEIESIKL